jgi:hypothetical protein
MYKENGSGLQTCFDIVLANKTKHWALYRFLSFEFIAKSDPMGKLIFIKERG